MFAIWKHICSVTYVKYMYSDVSRVMINEVTNMTWIYYNKMKELQHSMSIYETLFKTHKLSEIELLERKQSETVTLAVEKLKERK